MAVQSFDCTAIIVLATATKPEGEKAMTRIQKHLHKSREQSEE